MKLLILYYSRTGNNRILAKYLADKIGADIEEIRPIRTFKLLGFLLDFFRNRRPTIVTITKSPKNYDHTLFIAPLYDMGLAHPMKTVLIQLKGQLGPYSFVTFCGYERDGQTKHIHGELLDLTGIAPAYVQELWVEDLLPEDQRENVMKVSGYKVKETELEEFADSISQVIGWFKQAPG